MKYHIIILSAKQLLQGNQEMCVHLSISGHTLLFTVMSSAQCKSVSSCNQSIMCLSVRDLIISNFAQAQIVIHQHVISSTAVSGLKNISV